MRFLASNRRRRAVARVGATAGALAILATAGGAAGEPDLTYPNAPRYGQGFTTSYNTTTLTYAAKSKQWIRIPGVVLAANIFATNSHPGGVSSTCLKRFGEKCTPAPGADQRLFSDAMAFPVTTLPADPRDTQFDAFPDTTVRTVAFGSIPVEATLGLTLPTDKDGLPVGLHATTITDTFPGGVGNPPPEFSDPNKRWIRIHDTPVSGGVWVRVKSLLVDGVPVAVGSRCRTAQLATLDLLGKGYTAYEMDGTKVKPGAFNIGTGGTLNGTIDVPRFAGCGTGGEDLSPLVTSVASGAGFPVRVGTSDWSVACFGANPEVIDWSKCPPAPDLPIPTAAP